MKKMRISLIDQRILSACSMELLGFLVDISQHRSFPELKKLINLMIDAEKNVFFTQKEYDPDVLMTDHAFARGGVAKLTALIHIIGAAEQERNRRKDKDGS